MAGKSSESGPGGEFRPVEDELIRKQATGDLLEGIANQMSNREGQVLMMTSEGLEPKEIAEELGVSIPAVTEALKRGVENAQRFVNK